MVPLMRRFQRAVFQSASSDLPTSDHNFLSPRPPLLSFGREKSFGKAVFLLVSCRLLFRDAACFVVSPCSLLFSPRNFSYITAYSPSLTASSPLSHCRSLLHHHPSSPFPISRCLPFVQKKLKWGCSQRWISTLSPDLSHPTLLLTSQPCTLQVMHLYCASSIPLWCCFNNIPGCKFVAFVPCSMQIGLALICFPVIMVDSSFMEVVLFPKSSLLSPLSLQPIS
ncbi:hypothetical protein YC2023_038322 [Brassica napus]